MSRSPQRSHCILTTLLDDPRLLPERDELVRSALHRFLVCANSRRIIRNQRDQLLDVLVLVVPEFDAKRQAIVATAPHTGYENKQRTKSRTSEKSVFEFLEATVLLAPHGFCEAVRYF